MTAFDLVVVGGGTAGCVIAARASEDPRRRVLLLEAGPDPLPVPDLVSDPRRQGELVRTSDLVRRYPVTRPDGSSFELYSGRIMGGSSAVNNCAIARPLGLDFESWERFGGPDWSYRSLLPVMRRIEHDEDFGASELHGADGPLRLHRDFKLDDPADPPVAAMIEAAGRVGLPRCEDLNVTDPLGICASPYNLVNGARQSAADAYLAPARSRPNLEIRAGTLVERLLLAGDSVTGVEVRSERGTEVISGDRVVLCAGVYHTPQILMLSGIGPPAAPEAPGIAVRHALPGVGEHYQDHAVVDMAFGPGPDLEERYRMPKIRIVARSRPELDHPDLHLLVRSPMRRPEGTVLAVSVRLLDHRSTGRVALASADPGELPLVDHGLLTDANDRAALHDGMRLVQTLVTTPPLDRFYGPLLSPEPGVDWSDHIMGTFNCYHHGVGTCRIGPDDDPGAVVDGRLRVRGIENLWIADASVLPSIPRANTNLAAFLVGEIGAGQIAATDAT